MERDQEMRELAANVHDLSALLAALLVCFASMRRLARYHHKTWSIRSVSDCTSNPTSGAALVAELEPRVYVLNREELFAEFEVLIKSRKGCRFLPRSRPLPVSQR